MGRTSNPRLYWLDILRGVAALSVVLWHWVHFFLNDPTHPLTDTQIDRAQLPLHLLLKPFYGSGWRAVELFFTLSGFIFYWLYSGKIVRREINMPRYLVLRISRLYPLHFATLAAVIAGQLWFFQRNGSWFIYDMNWPAFPGSLTLTANWFSSGFSFNGPAWSVSIEMLMYLLFFVLCRAGLVHCWQAIVLIVLGWLLRGTHLDLVGLGMMSFFAGGVAWHSFTWMRNRLGKSAQIAVIVSMFPVLLALMLILRYGGPGMPIYFVELAVFPVIVCALALGESLFGPGPGRHLHFIGDISYSSYLWHFPLQLGFVIVAMMCGLPRSIFYHPASLGVFYAVLIALSMASYYLFERPVQNFLRRKWSTAR